MKASILHAWAGILLLLATGCQTVNTTERAEPTGQRDLVSEKRVLTDSSLGRKVQIVAVNQSIGAGGLLTAQVELLNTTRRLQSFSYKFEWFDDQGMAVSTATSVMIPRQVEGKESIFISGTAPHERAKDFRLKLIEPTN